MAGQVRRLYADLIRGWHPNAPPRAMDPDSNSPYIFRDAQNFIERDGVLVRRSTLTAANAGFEPAYQLLSGAADDSEAPIIILPINYYTTSGAPALLLAIVTSRNIWVAPNVPTGFINCTPKYSTGTVSATNGSNAVVGAGTSWLTNNNIVGGVITISGVNYQIASITTDTNLTLTTNYTGATAGGLAYTIIRTFPGLSPFNSSTPNCAEMFAVINQNTLYVAGSFCGSSSINTVRPAVIKVADINTATPTTTYLTGNVLLQTGMDTISNLTRIVGLQVLQDGRVVVTGERNTVFYSSLLNDAVWTVSPGGQVPIDSIQSRITAFGQLGDIYTIHHQDGVVLANPTGQSDPPLTYRASAASIGVFAPRTLKALGGVEYGLASSGEVLRFDRYSSSIVSEPLRGLFDALSTSTLYGAFHAFIDKGRQEYTLCQQLAAGAKLWTYQIRQERWWPLQSQMPISAVSDDPAHTTLVTTSIRALAGVWSINGSAENPSLIYYFNEDGTADAIAYSGSTADRYFIDLDDLDFGLVDGYKTGQRVVLWGFRTVSTTIPVTVSLSRDNGVTWTAATTQNWPATINTEKALQFCFDELGPGAEVALRFRIEIGTTSFGLQLRRMLVVALESGSLEQVEL